MKNEEKLILMNKDDEVLSFFVDYKNIKIKILEKLEHYDKAPYKVLKNEEFADMSLLRFFNVRTISNNRWDYKLIIEATKSINSFQLSFKGHGLSLSDHFWVKREGENLKYKDINFFTNKWDDTFARAVLSGNYEALKNCDLNVPDIVTPGWAVKGWIIEDVPKLYKLGIDKDSSDESIAEVLASKLALRLLNEDEVNKYELRKVGEKYASVSPLMIKENEELVALSNVVPAETHTLYLSKSKDKNLDRKFFEIIKRYKIPKLYEFFVKLSVIRSLCFVSDLHFENISLIKNLETNEFRVAPLYDLGGSFGSSRTGKEMLSKPNKGLFLLIYFLFNTLEPDWDYSWYDPAKLNGFEEEIRDMLSKSKFYTPELIERVIAVYQMQKQSLDKVAKR